MRSVLLISLVLFFSQAVLSQSTAHSVQELYLARDDGSGKAGAQVNEFRTTDIPIFCVVMLDTTEKVTVKMNFVAVDVAGVKADTKVVSASYTTAEGQNQVNFSGRPEGRWVPGRYRVDIILDGKVAGNIEFDIKRTGGTAAASPAQLKPPAKSAYIRPVSQKK